MEIKLKQQEFIDYGNHLKGAQVYFRDDWQCYYFSLQGKCFGMMNNELITLKGLPEKNEWLREMYEEVTPGYYANKNHWNSIYLATEALSNSEIIQLIQASYELVYQKLPKKIKQELLNPSKD